jgi:hypothetical protein
MKIEDEAGQLAGRCDDRDGVAVAGSDPQIEGMQRTGLAGRRPARLDQRAAVLGPGTVVHQALYRIAPGRAQQSATKGDGQNDAKSRPGHHWAANLTMDASPASVVDGPWKRLLMSTWRSTKRVFEHTFTTVQRPTFGVSARCAARRDRFPDSR